MLSTFNKFIPANSTALYSSCFFFASMALSVKLCTQPSELLGEHHLPAIQIVFFRSFFCMLLLLPLLMRDLKTHPIGRQHVKPMLLRSLAGGLAMIAYFSAISRLPLATAVLLNYTSPLWAGLFAFVFLQEMLPLGLILAYPLALAGVLLVVGSPGVNHDLPAVVLGLASAVLAGAAYTALRGLRDTPASIVVTGLCLVSTIVAAPLCYINYQAPSNAEWALLWFCALASAIAQILMTVGYRTVKTAAASTVGLATVAISGLLSCLVLGELLSIQQWIGIIVLLGATSQTGRRSFFSRWLRLVIVFWKRPAYHH